MQAGVAVAVAVGVGLAVGVAVAVFGRRWRGCYRRGGCCRGGRGGRRCRSGNVFKADIHIRRLAIGDGEVSCLRPDTCL